jgi:alcohol dehydrogenase (cytochrome c)
MKLMKRLLQMFVIGAISVVLLCGVAALASTSVAWRLKLLKVKLFGEIPEIPFPLLLKWIRPGSSVDLRHLAEVPNINASIINKIIDAKSVESGALNFGRVCAQCHGDDARGRTGPNLLVLIGNMTDWKFFSTVKWGRPKTAMMAQPLSDVEIWQVCAFLRRSAIDATMGKKDTDAGLPTFQPVSPDMLRSAGQTGDWLTYAGNYAGYRHAIQDQITRRNVPRVRLAWAAQLPSDGGFQESSPIVVGGRMLVTEPPEGVTALNAKTGAVLWEFHRPVPPDIPRCCGSPNRGVAVLGKNVYVETLDSHLVALDAATGAEIWDAKVADWRQGYTMTGSPLAIEDRIVVGIAGGDFGIRGFLAAYAASDGAQKWKFYTVPGPGQPGHETWANDSWQHGGAATWNTGSYDPALGLIYWGTGNPAPVHNTKTRPGNNLYSDSVVALDASTGELHWYFQFTPADDRGWDSTEQPILADIKWQGQTIPALFLANRNAFFYALDRRTGHFLFARPFAKQTWASGFTEDGRPIPLPTSHPSPTGTVIWPAALGATNWWPPSFDPKRNLLFVPSVDVADIFFNIEFQDYREGRSFLASGSNRAHNQPITLAIRAIDVSTGQLRWDSTTAAGGGEVPEDMGGVLSTGGDLVFAGYSNEFAAFDADTGAKLWSTNLGGGIHAAPISYTVADRQYIAIVGGRTLFVFALPPGDQGTGTRVSRSPPRTGSHEK